MRVRNSYCRWCKNTFYTTHDKPATLAEEESLVLTRLDPRPAERGQRGLQYEWNTRGWLGDRKDKDKHKHYLCQSKFKNKCACSCCSLWPEVCLPPTSVAHYLLQPESETIYYSWWFGVGKAAGSIVTYIFTNKTEHGSVKCQTLLKKVTVFFFLCFF